MSVPVPHPPNFNIDQGYEYYAGKPELLDWINRLLQLNLQRLEQVGAPDNCEDLFHNELTTCNIAAHVRGCILSSPGW